MKKISILKFVVIAFAWTWSFWIPAFIILKTNNWPLYSQDTISKIFTDGFISPLHIVATILVSVGTYGPAISAFICRKKAEAKIKTAGKVQLPIVLAFVILFPLLLSLFPGVLGSIINGTSYVTTFSLIFFIPFVLYQFVTSSFEEIGWRGYALPQLLQTNDAVDAGWNLGWIWAIWHFPLMFYLYWSLPFMAIASSLLGFSMVIVGTSIIYTWIYVNTKKLWIAMLFHALLNTTSAFFLGSTQNPAVVLLPAAITWICVIILQKKYGKSLLMSK